MKRLVYFTVRGYVETEQLENVSEGFIEDRFRDALQKIQLQSNEKFNFDSYNLKDVEVTILTPKSEEIKKQETDILNTLADHFRSLGVTPEMGELETYYGSKFPAIVCLNGVRSPEHDFVAYVEYNDYDLNYQICVAPYLVQKNGHCSRRTLTWRQDYDYPKLVKRLMDNLISQGLLKI